MRRTVVVTVPAGDVELAADRLWAAGARAVEERDGIAGSVELHTVLATDDQASQTRLGAVPGEWRVDFVDVDAAPAETWREHARTIEIADDLAIRPAWIASTDDGRTEVVVEPGASFGLGDHPTTRLSAAEVWRADPTRALDVGCGSGVLAIIAAFRGASEVVAIDVAEAAREATLANAARNGVAHVIEASTRPLEDVDGRFDLVVANILAPTLVALAADLRRVTAVDGSLIVSGILADHHDHVIDALAPLEVVRTTELEGWAAVELRWPSGAEQTSNRIG